MVTCAVVEPFELQVRTYVTGPSSDQKRVRGYWMFDLLLTDALTTAGARVIFKDTIRVKVGNQRVERSATGYNLTASKLPLADGSAGAIKVCLVRPQGHRVWAPP